MGQYLVDNHFIHRVDRKWTFDDDDSLYEIIDTIPKGVLNAGPMSNCKSMRGLYTQRIDYIGFCRVFKHLFWAADELSEFLRRLTLILFDSYLHDDGRKVDYDNLKSSKEFQAYKRLISQLVRVQIENATREAKIAFFVNVYNALTVHGLIECQQPRTTLQRYKACILVSFYWISYKASVHQWLVEIFVLVFQQHQILYWRLHVQPTRNREWSASSKPKRNRFS